MQAYMKSELPYLGAQTAAVERACRRAFPEHELRTFAEWRDTVLALWRDASFREERYAALVLARWKDYARFRTAAALPLYEELVVTGAWWDYVDWLATRHLRELLEREPDAAKAAMSAWSRSEDVWKRRASIICQVGRKGATDVDLLVHCVEPSLERNEFWLRKAIGWALREYSKTDGAWVVAYVRSHEDELSPLSRREALKWLRASGSALVEG